MMSGVTWRVLNIDIPNSNPSRMVSLQKHLQNSFRPSRTYSQGMRVLTYSPLLSPLRRSFFMTQSKLRMSLSTAVAHSPSSSHSHSHSHSPSPPRSTESPNHSKRRRLHSPVADTMLAPKIELNEKEETVRRLLVDVGSEIDTYNRTTGARNKDPVILRFTGGWVRDKLLGIPSHDIDVGISRMTGYEFGLYLAEFLRRHYHCYGIEAGTVHKIDSNPEKSKHLETATMKILGFDIDLVNLRSEAYKGDTRVPQMEFGTPTQDALRRDCTINALFYNLHSQRVEDFTGCGLTDMENKVIRTPLRPQETFEDDPLRMLRLIRFSSRLGFEITPEAKEAMKLPGVKEALSIKISRERVGTEVEKMLKGNNPQAALNAIYSLDLYTATFAPPTDIHPLPIHPLPIHHMAIATLAVSHIFTLSPKTHPGIASLTPTENEIYISYLLAALTPWEGVQLGVMDKKRAIPAAATAVREGLKATNMVYDIIIKAFNNVSMVREEMRLADGWSKSQAGKWVRRCGADWRCQVMCSLLLELVGAWEEGVDVPSEDGRNIIERYEVFVDKIHRLGMADAWTVKPILGGGELLAALNIRKSGPWVAVALGQVLEWQWDNPEKGKEEVLEWVKSARDLLAPGM